MQDLENYVLEMETQMSALKIHIQSILDKLNLLGTEKNGSTYRMFHLSELLDKWNLYETEKNVPLIELFSYLKSQETEEFTNNQKQGEEEKKMLYRYLCST